MNIERVTRTAAVLGVAVVATVAFIRSFTALADLAVQNEVPTHQAWMLPVMLDTSIIVTTLALLTMTRRRWLAWSLLGATAGMSLAGNIAHVWHAGPIAIAIAAVPPLLLLGMTELAATMLRPAPAGVRPLLPRASLRSAVPDLAESWRAKRTA